MENDYSAAHSMDTNWFAVDSLGQVGHFYTNESGFMPVTAVAAEPLQFHTLATIQGRGHLPGIDEEEGHIEDLEDLRATLLQLGIYVYEYLDTFGDPDEMVNPYTLLGAPAAPIHIDQLPPSLREFMSAVRFPELTFGANPAFQPIEGGDCVFYYSGAVAYLNAERTLLRAIPNKPRGFATFRRTYKKRLPKHLQHVRFEDPK